MTRNPLVSIIMPAHNCEKHIEESIQGVTNQIYRYWELIIVNDGSTDKTRQVIEQYLSDHRIKVVDQRNLRQGAARNTGIRVSKGEILAFLDADDVWKPNKLSKHVPHLLLCKADMIFAGGLVFNEHSKNYTYHKVLVRKLEGQLGYETLLKKNIIMMSTVIARKKKIQDVGLFESDLALQNCEDYSLWLKILKSGGTIEGVDDFLVVYRRHSDASTHISLNQNLPLLRLYLQEYDGKNKSLENNITRLYKTIVGQLINSHEYENSKMFANAYIDFTFSNSAVKRILNLFGAVVPPKLFARIVIHAL